MIKIFKLSQAIRLPSIINMHGYKFSKKLKQKIKHELKNEKRTQVDEERQNYLRSYPTVQPATFAERKGLDIVLQFVPFMLQFGTCILFSSQSYSGFYIYNLFGAEKILGLILLANLSYPKNTLHKLLIIGGIVLPLFIPITNLYGIGTQALQLIILIMNNPTQVDDTSYLTQEQKKLISQRHKIRLILYLCILGVFTLKGLYHYRILQFENKIKQYNQKNKEIFATNQNNPNIQAKSS